MHSQIDRESTSHYLDEYANKPVALRIEFRIHMFSRPDWHSVHVGVANILLCSDMFFYVCLLMIFSYRISTTCFAGYETNIFILNGINFFKNTIFVVVWNEYDFMASNSFWICPFIEKKRLFSLRIIDSNELTHHIGTCNVHIHFANFTVNQLIWYAVGWSGLALILIFNWYGIQLDFGPRLHSI